MTSAERWRALPPVQDRSLRHDREGEIIPIATLVARLEIVAVYVYERTLG
jgi:hypothetical protein